MKIESDSVLCGVVCSRSVVFPGEPIKFSSFDAGSGWGSKNTVKTVKQKKYKYDK